MTIGCKAPSEWSFATTKCGLRSLLTQHAKDINLPQAIDSYVLDFNVLEFDTRNIINAVLVDAIEEPDIARLAAVANDNRFFEHAVQEASGLGLPTTQAQRLLREARKSLLEGALAQVGVVRRTVNTTSLTDTKNALASTIETSYHNFVVTQFERLLHKRCLQAVQYHLPKAATKTQASVTAQVCEYTGRVCT